MFNPFRPITDYIKEIWKKYRSYRVRKLSSDWTVELEEDLKIMHGVNIDAELVSIMADKIQRDIDKEITKELLSSKS